MKPDQEVLFNPTPFVRRAIYAMAQEETISASRVADSLILKRPGLIESREMLQRCAASELRRMWGGG